MADNTDPNAKKSPATVQNAQSVAAVVPPPEYFQSPSGQWIECDWDTASKTYRCHKINADQLPKSTLGNG